MFVVHHQFHINCLNGCFSYLLIEYLQPKRYLHFRYSEIPLQNHYMHMIVEVDGRTHFYRPF